MKAILSLSRRSPTIFTLLFLFVLSSVAIAMEDYDTVTYSKSKEVPTPFCPVTKFSDNKKCFDCHVMKIIDEKPVFGLDEIPISAGYNLPFGTSIVPYSGGLALYWKNTGTGSDRIRDVSHYIIQHPEFTRFIMEIHSPGGSVMDAWRAVGIIEELRGEGVEIETRCYGMAASAGTILLVSGDKGLRKVNCYAEIMLHKLWTFAMFSVSDPDTSEDKAALMKHFQDNINSYIISRTKITSEMLDKNMFKKDWWVNGKTAIELGIADLMVK